jgi:hypothetical protein
LQPDDVRQVCVTVGRMRDDEPDRPSEVLVVKACVIVLR